MAGRGTDIKLGGNLEVRLKSEIDETFNAEKKELLSNKITNDLDKEKENVINSGGLAVIATERHESRRIDNQLRGRSGRQGDPGQSSFFLSLEDDLMRIFGSERMDGMLKKLGLKEDEAIVHPWVNKAIQKAQQKVEARNYDIRKNLLKFDDVMNDQRKVIYEQRIELIKSNNISEIVKDMRDEVIDTLIANCIPEKAFPDQWNSEELTIEIKRIFNLDLPIVAWASEEGIADQEIKGRVSEEVNKLMSNKLNNYGTELWNSIERHVTLQVFGSTLERSFAKLRPSSTGYRSKGIWSKRPTK
jgi:Preprotein translocase subunit SecA (ATPase, RNA helicase)